MPLVAVFGLVAVAWFCRGLIFAAIYIVLGYGALETTTVIAKAATNNVMTAVGGSAPYVLPPRTSQEASAKVTTGGITTQTTRRETSQGVRYDVAVKGTMTNGSPWSFDRVVVKCYYRTHEMGGEALVFGRGDITIAPGQTAPFAANVTIDAQWESRGLVSTQCTAKPIA